ncbi:hypothetical protein [Arthrobacter bambusae]|uniref:hypothetical protein n=1 Tax=Arthrobacter bambusae TaxID=1338426 RepID=UPI002785C152|nr:hypothetical protein [Arthrobacter bambusae]MDQ0241405.1 DNA-directed RNA polymerase specialized sigma24 family protein [Arthrobacter bambusae]
MSEDLDVDEILRNGDEADLSRVWNLQHERSLWQRVIDRSDATHRGIAQEKLATLPEVNPLQALQANARLIKLLTGRRWMVIQEAREHGASWDEIGAALGISKQGAHDFYRRAIEQQETYLPDTHDATRARAVLDPDERA